MQGIGNGIQRIINGGSGAVTTTSAWGDGIIDHPGPTCHGKGTL